MRFRLLSPSRLWPLAFALIASGCGGADDATSIGSLMAGLSDAGYTDVWGAEMSPYRVAMCEARFPGRIFAGGYKGVPDERRFDVILANHVLEHIYSPSQAIEWMAGHLNERGVILITVR
ncbi:MAG: methyltransferase domain-containing protein, partial [SAR324 cluster bacterium]|nr:methyltransferase domain-containing protein [SAR324 cluster bacterium]